MSHSAVMNGLLTEAKVRQLHMACGERGQAASGCFKIQIAILMLRTEKIDLEALQQF